MMVLGKPKPCTKLNVASLSNCRNIKEEFHILVSKDVNPLATGGRVSSNVWDENAIGFVSPQKMKWWFVVTRIFIAIFSIVIWREIVFIRSFIHSSSIHPFIHLSIHLSIHPSTHSLIHSFIHKAQITKHILQLIRTRWLHSVPLLHKQCYDDDGLLCTVPTTFSIVWSAATFVH